MFRQNKYAYKIILKNKLLVSNSTKKHHKRIGDHIHLWYGNNYQKNKKNNIPTYWFKTGDYINKAFKIETDQQKPQ